jgi:hypothetical protein
MNPPASPEPPPASPAARRRPPTSTNPADHVPDPSPSTHPRHQTTPGHPDSRGTLPLARHLTDPNIEDEIQTLADEAPLPTLDQAARLARLLRLHQRRRRPPTDRTA